MPEVLPWTQVALAASLVLLAGVLSLLLRLRLESQLFIGAVRATIQLSLVGLVLKAVFEDGGLALTAAAFAAMVLLAAQAALKRAGYRIDGAFVGTSLTLALCAGTASVFGGAVVLGAESWYAPRYVLPLLGMLLGNGLTGISLCLDSLLSTFHEQADQVEAELALGASRIEALQAPLRVAVRRGVMPIVNAMMVAGIVSLPGMMTGQILAGVEPTEAVKVQLVILFLIAGATSVACLGIAMFCGLRLVDADGQVRRDRVSARR